MTTTTATEAAYLTLPEAAAELRCEPGVLWRAHREGRLAILYLAGTARAGRRGGKDGRIGRDEFERFKLSLTVRVVPAPAPAGPPKPGRPRGGRKAAAGPMAGWDEGL